jgi:hypothetical protein
MGSRWIQPIIIMGVQGSGKSTIGALIDREQGVDGFRTRFPTRNDCPGFTKSVSASRSAREPVWWWPARRSSAATAMFSGSGHLRCSPSSPAATKWLFGFRAPDSVPCRSILAGGLFVPREAQNRLGEPLRREGQISLPLPLPLPLPYLPCFASVLAAERPAPFLVRASGLWKHGRGDRI